MTTTSAQPADRVGPPRIAILLPVLMPGIILAAVLGIVLGGWGITLGLTLTAAAVVIRSRTFGRDVEAHVLAGLALRPATDADAAGLRNLTEGLAASAGVPMPELRLLDAPGANVMVVGTTPQSSVVIVTTGLLGALSRIQLEGVVARALVAIRQGAVVSPTWSIELTRSPVTRLFAGTGSSADPDREVLLDRDAAGLTRYPPGLLGALEACAAVGTDVASAPAGSTALWMVDPNGGEAVRAELDHRIAALRLL